MSDRHDAERVGEALLVKGGTTMLTPVRSADLLLLEMCEDPVPCQTDRWDWQKETFVRQRTILWDPSRLGLYRTDIQKRGFSGVTGTFILREAERIRVPLPNIHVLHFLRAHPHRAPQWVKEGWYLYFVRPLYIEKKSDLFARYLHWNRERDNFDEGDTLFTGAGFTARCGLVTYDGVRPL